MSSVKTSSIQYFQVGQCVTRVIICYSKHVSVMQTAAVFKLIWLVKWTPFHYLKLKFCVKVVKELKGLVLCLEALVWSLLVWVKLHSCGMVITYVITSNKASLLVPTFCQPCIIFTCIKGSRCASRGIEIPTSLI